MKANSNIFSLSKHANIKMKWSFEKKMTIGAILVILTGFVTFGKVLEKISSLNSYMENTNDMRVKVAKLEERTILIATDMQEVKSDLRIISTYILQTKNENNHSKR